MTNCHVIRISLLVVYILRQLWVDFFFYQWIKKHEEEGKSYILMLVDFPTLLMCSSVLFICEWWCCVGEGIHSLLPIIHTGNNASSSITIVLRLRHPATIQAMASPPFSVSFLLSRPNQQKDDGCLSSSSPLLGRPKDALHHCYASSFSLPALPSGWPKVGCYHLSSF